MPLNTIHNEVISFRCPNVLKERLQLYGDENDLRLSQVIRRACADFVRQPAPAAIQATKSGLANTAAVIDWMAEASK